MFQIDIVSFAYGAAAFTVITTLALIVAVYLEERGGQHDK